MSLAGPLAKVASKLMLRFGGAVTFRRVTNGVYNPTTGTITEGITDTAIKGVLEDVVSREVAGLVRAGDKKLTIAANDLPVVPTIADQILLNTRKLQIIEVRTIEQDNTPITYELILRD
jgi:hypothetical protein